MSTLGIPYHRRSTFQVDDTEACEKRAARHAARDAAYRAALGLNPDEPLPKRIGSRGNTGGGGRRSASSYFDLGNGGRVRRSSAPL